MDVYFGTPPNLLTFIIYIQFIFWKENLPPTQIYKTWLAKLQVKNKVRDSLEEIALSATESIIIIAIDHPVGPLESLAARGKKGNRINCTILVTGKEEMDWFVEIEIFLAL